MNVFLLLALLSAPAFAFGFTWTVKVQSVSKASISEERKYVNNRLQATRTFTAEYQTGGCDPATNAPKVSLAHVSTEDLTSKETLQAYPEAPRLYRVVVQVEITETRSRCERGYTLSVKEDLTALFFKTAPKFGLELDRKVEDNEGDTYEVEFLAPPVKRKVAIHSGENRD
jgi:hypothetical protein